VVGEACSQSLTSEIRKVSLISSISSPFKKSNTCKCILNFRSNLTPILNHQSGLEGKTNMLGFQMKKHC